MVSEAPDRLRVSVSCIDDDGRFLREATGRGADLSPEILLAGMDERARSLAVVLEDITHPLFGTMTHWLIWNLDPAVRIPGEIPAGRRVGRTAARQGVGYGVCRYRGPKPPRGRTHTYRFTVYVLDSVLNISSASRRRRFDKAVLGHVLQEAMVEAVYE